MTKRSTLLYSLLLMLTAIIWGFGFIVVKNSLDDFTTLYLLAFRFTIGATGMCLVFFKKLKKITLSDIKCGSILGFFMFIAFTFQIKALDYTTVGKNAFLTAAYVVLVPLLCWFLYKKRPNINSFIATFLCMIGIGLLSLDSSFNINLGDFLTLICACFYALHIVFSDTYIKKHDPIILNILQLSFAAIYAWITAPIFEPFPSAFHLDSTIGILYLGIACTMLAFLFQAIGQKNTPPAVASLILSTESVFGCLFSVVLLGEVLDAKMLVGCLLIFISILISDIGIDIKVLFSRFKRENIKQLNEDI